MKLCFQNIGVPQNRSSFKIYDTNSNRLSFQNSLIKVYPSPLSISRRSRKPQVRLVSVVDGLDVTLPLLSSQPPPNEVEADNEQPAGAPPDENTATSAEKNKKLPVKKTTAAGNATSASQEPCEDSATKESEGDGWESQEVPASSDSFFFAVPPLPTPGCKQVSFTAVCYCHQCSMFLAVVVRLKSTREKRAGTVPKLLRCTQ